MRGLMIIFLGAAMLLLGNKIGHDAGYAKAKRDQAEAKAEHDKIMRDVGTCDWAQIMAKRIQCQKIERQ